MQHADRAIQPLDSSISPTAESRAHSTASVTPLYFFDAGGDR